MSTLGRKSMKKTLILLRQDAFKKMKQTLEGADLKKQIDKLNHVKAGLKRLSDEAEKAKSDSFTIKDARELAEFLRTALECYVEAGAFSEKLLEASQSLLTYVEPLESYTSELDEAWDRYGATWESLSKKMKQAVEELPHPKKDKKKKTTYID